MKFNRSIWILLVIGAALRCVAINQPLVDAHLARQCQTAAATKNLIEESGFHLTSKVPWLGDIDARYILELPIYNYLAIGMWWLTNNLDVSGKLTSVLLWGASFICLQFIWRRFLDSQQTFWANLLFVIAPLSVFYGQAFMPEMLVQLSAFAFVLLVLRYDENPSLVRWSLCAGVGLVGSLLKLPEIGHLYVILAILIIWREGWRALIRPRYLLAAIATIVILKAWGSYVDSVNAAYVSSWTSKETLRVFIGPLANRFHFKPWAMIFLYVGAFIIPGPVALGVAYGTWKFRLQKARKILGLWMLSLLLFYLVWFGSGPTAQSYYNLPALAPLCALFGIGMKALLEWQQLVRWRRTATVVAIILVVLPAIPAGQYLFKPDTQILEAARWMRANSRPEDVVLFRPNHRWDAIAYPNNPAFAYYSERPTFVWTDNTSPEYRRMALERASYAVVTLPPAPTTGLIGALKRFRGNDRYQPETMDWLDKNGFRILASEKGFAVYRRN
ncbi:MAG: glycosyltransferase family 39 protein [Verrucomicrobiota bacterium]